jgi:hypothetical protein
MFKYVVILGRRVVQILWVVVVITIDWAWLRPRACSDVLRLAQMFWAFDRRYK